MPDVGRYTPVGASDALTAGVADFLLTPALGGGCSSSATWSCSSRPERRWSRTGM